jgi:hypothetical protein
MGAMKGLLGFFRSSRIMYKQLAEEFEKSDPKKSKSYDRKQLPIKIFINSMFGALSAPQVFLYLHWEGSPPPAHSDGPGACAAKLMCWLTGFLCMICAGEARRAIANIYLRCRKSNHPLLNPEEEMIKVTPLEKLTRPISLFDPRSIFDVIVSRRFSSMSSSGAETLEM